MSRGLNCANEPNFMSIRQTIAKIWRTDASNHIYATERLVINVKASFRA